MKILNEIKLHEGCYETICVGEEAKKRTIAFSSFYESYHRTSVYLEDISYYYISLPNIKYEISFAYLDKKFRFYNLNLKFSNQDYTKFYAPFLPNIYTSSKVCSDPSSFKTFDNVEDLIKNTINSF